MEIVLPSIWAISVAIFGGALMGWAMFRLLPGMKSNSYQPKEWMPVSLYITSLGWFTYFVPQFILNDLGSFWQQFLYGGVVFTAYMVSLVIVMLYCQLRRRD